MNKVWVITQGDREVFCSVWITHKLAWREILRVAREYRADMPDVIKKARFKYPPDKSHLMALMKTSSGKWRNAEVWHVTEVPVQGDIVTALAEVIACQKSDSAPSTSGVSADEGG